MPAIPHVWMESNRWKHESLDWAAYAYHLLAPQINVRGRMALLLLFAVIWAFSWLLWRAYCVIQTPNEILVDKLGLDIPPAPLVTLEDISAREIQISWKPSDSSTSVQEHYVEVNGRVAGTTKRNETTAIISNLHPGNTYDIRIFSISAGRFQTPSTALHVRLPADTLSSSEAGSNYHQPSVRAIAAKSTPNLGPLSAPVMAREPSGGQPIARRGTAVRKASPAGHMIDLPTSHSESVSKSVDDDIDENLVELSQRFQKIQQDIEAVEAQIQEEDRDFELTLKNEEAKRDKLRQDLKERDEHSSDLRRQVHKAETANRAAHSEKTKKERELQQREKERRKRREEMEKWEDQISSMTEEMAGIETQKAAIERRTQSDIREVRRKIEEEQKEVSLLEEENKEKALQIKALEEERKQLNAEDETEETREADRMEHERTLRWRERFANLNATYTRIWTDLQQAQQHYNIARDRLALYESVRRNATMSFAPVAPLDMEAVRRGVKPVRRPRHAGSYGSSVSSPRGPFSGEGFHPATQLNAPPIPSPTAYGPSFFNPQNGMTLIMPTEPTHTVLEDLEPIASVPMSPRADALLPADLLGDESADEIAEDDVEMPTKPKGQSSATGPFAKIGSPSLRVDVNPADSPSAGSSSGRSFSSPREMFETVAESDDKSFHSGIIPNEDSGIGDTVPTNSRKLMANLFSFNRQRGKSMANQGPSLGSLKSRQSQSFPRKFDDFDVNAQPRRRLSYGGNWQFPGNFLQRGNGANADKDRDMPQFPSSRRAFPSLIPGFGKSSASSAPYDPFASRSESLDAGLRGETSSPRPSSTYSFDRMPRPSLESQFHAWNVDKPAMRNSPLAPDWASLHSFSRNHSRRPSVVQGSTSNLSLPPHTDEEIVEPIRDSSRPLQAPIGTRPTSSQTLATPKLNPAAPSFNMLFGKRSEKAKEKPKQKDVKDKSNETDGGSPSESRKSKDTHSIAATTSTIESHDSLDRVASGNSANTPVENVTTKPTFMSKITRKASSNKFGSWKEKGGIFSRKDVPASTDEAEEDHASLDQGDKSTENVSITPTEDKKSNRTSLGNWNFMRKNKKGLKEDLTASELSENSERASEVEEETTDQET